jgi:hypothetical protein
MKDLFGHRVWLTPCQGLEINIRFNIPLCGMLVPKPLQGFSKLNNF